MTLCYMYIKYFISVFLSFCSFTHINTESPEADPENKIEQGGPREQDLSNCQMLCLHHPI